MYDGLVIYDEASVEIGLAEGASGIRVAIVPDRTLSLTYDDAALEVAKCDEELLDADLLLGMVIGKADIASEL